MSKLEGFQLFRGTAVFKVQVNGTPFQQGKLICHFLPVSALYSSTTQGAYYTSMHIGETGVPNLACITQQPHVEYDINYSGDEIRIPYVNIYNWFNFNSPVDTSWGTFYVRVLSPLLSGVSGQSADVTLFLHFEDVEMSAPRIPQMMTKVPPKKIKRNNEAREQKDPVMRGISRAERVAINMGMPKYQVASAAWVARFAARLASAFGYSKTSLNTDPVPVVDQFNRYSANSDGIDSSVALAVIHDNALGHKDLVPSELDQMSFDYLLRVPALVGSFAWSLTDNENTLLYSRAVRPDTFYETHNRTVGSSSITYRSGPPMFYFNHAFQHWRGSIELTFKFVKNDYYSGKIAITFSPGNNTAVPDLQTGQFSLRTIVDLRETDTVVINLPWLIAQDWMDTVVSNSNSNVITSNTLGTVRMNVINRLKCPTSCAGLINVLVYARGGPDFEFARPIRFVPTDSNLIRVPFNPQIGDIVETIGGYPDTEESMHYTENCMGEKITSIKQILNRYQKCNAATGDMDDNVVSLNPFIPMYAYKANNSVTTLTAGLHSPWHDLVAPLYAFHRGSARILRSPNIPVKAQMFLTKSAWGVLPATTIEPMINDFADFASAGYGVFPDVERSIHVAKVPYQNKFRMLPNCAIANASYQFGSVYYNDTYLGSAITTSEEVTSKYYKSFCDDFELLYFIGCPPLAYSVATVI